MALKGQALRAVVAEKLLIVADEIFRLFERTYAECQAEILRSKLLQRPHVVLYREDIRKFQTVAVAADSGLKPDGIKEEENSTLKIPLPSVKTVQDVKQSSLEKAKENRQDSTGEEPGCSTDLYSDNNNQRNSLSDTNDSSDCKSMGKGSTKCDGQKLKPGHSKNSVEKMVISNNLLLKYTPKNNLHIYSCAECGVKYRHRVTLLRHIRSKHKGEKSHKCSVCQRSFFRRSDYEVHMRIHTGEMPFKCSHCGKRYRYKKSLKHHKCPQSEGRDHGNEHRTSETEMSDIQTVIVGADSCSESTAVKQEEDSTLNIPLPSEKAPKGLNKSTQEKDPGKENELASNSSSDTNNSSDEEFMDKSSTKNEGQDVNLGHNEATTTCDGISDDQPLRCAKCLKLFESQTKLKKHLRYHEGEGSFTCRACNKVFGHKNGYKRHLQTPSHKDAYKKRLQKRFHCSICKQDFSFLSRLNEHMRIHAPDKPFSCTVCWMKFRQRPSLVRHVRDIHNTNKRHACSVCQKTFSRKYEYVIHMRIHTGERPFRCTVCGAGYREGKMLTKHMKKHKVGTKICGVQSQSPGHRKVDRNDSLWSGSVPSTTERELYDIQAVIVGADSGPEPTTVKQEKDSTIKSQLPSVKKDKNINKSAHDKNRAREQKQDSVGDQCEEVEPGCSMDTHLEDNEQQNSCSDTDNSSDWEFMDKNLIKHDGQHLKAGHNKITAAYDLMNHKCPECFKSFKSETLLKKHLWNHADQGTFPCKICNRVYSRRSSYKQHMRTHSKNSLRCPICQKAFGISSRLKEHMSIHTGEKPYSCPVCGLKFRLRSTRQRHVSSVHNVHKPYTCSVCQKGFSEKHTYVVHMRIHTGERPFRCSVCGAGYRERKLLTKHMRSHEDGEVMGEVLE